MKLTPTYWLSLFCVVSAFLCLAPVASAQTFYDESEVDVKPVPKRNIRVKFPSSLKKKGVTGEIVLRFIVNTEGRVENIQVIKFADADMVEPAYEVYEKARFEPGQKGGEKVNTQMKVSIPYPPTES